MRWLEEGVLDAGQAVQDLPGSWIDRLEVGEEALVQLVGTWIRREPHADFGPVRLGREQASSDGGEERISQAGAYGLVRDHLLSARHIGDDLGPQATLGATADRNQTFRRRPNRIVELNDLPNAERDPFVRGAEKVARRCRNVRPATRPRASGSKCGVRSPAK
jgi:hypothetical protein